jgi:hypothetical protein
MSICVHPMAFSEILVAQCAVFLYQTLICLLFSFLLVIIMWRLDETTWDKVTIQNTSI